MTGYAPNQILGHTPRILQGPDTDPKLLRRLRATLERGEVFEGRAINYRRNGTPFHMEWRIAPMHGPDGRIRFFVAVQRDVTAEERSLQQLRDEARHDALTAALNRRAMEVELQAEIERARRHDPAFSVVMLDIDGFKAINDTYGHRAGDEVLGHMAQRIGNRLRDADLLARWGGEEFLLALPHTDADEAVVVADSAREYVRSSEFPGSIAVTISAGVAQWQPGETPTQLVERADQAMYRSKAAGGDRASRA